jgi:hypothetical protein
MKGGATAAEIAFTAAQLAAGTAPPLYTAYVSALARCGELSQVRRPLSNCVSVPSSQVHITLVAPSAK